jgi:hypothetical protein
MNPNDRAVNRAMAAANEALRSTQAVGIPLTAPLVDNTPVGSFWARVGISIPTTGISVPIKLPRIPSAYIVVDNNTNAVIYRTGPDKLLANPNQIVLRSTVSATVVSLLIG